MLALLLLAPAFTASSVLPANERTPRPLQPAMLVSIYGRHLGPDVPCTRPRGAVNIRSVSNPHLTK
jgi:hypothetical protein